jgi:hypothetical protein
MDHLIENDTFVIFLPSDSIDNYPNNSQSDYVVEFPKSIELIRPMECAIIEIIYPHKIKLTSDSTHKYGHIYIDCDVVKESYVGKDKRQILNHFIYEIHPNKERDSANFEHPIFIPVKKNLFNSIHITLKDQFNNIIKFEDSGSVIITLMFRPIEHV